MISDLALYICLNMTTCYLMFETAITHPTGLRGDRVGAAVVSVVFGLAALMLGYHVSEWVSINLGG